MKTTSSLTDNGMKVAGINTLPTLAVPLGLITQVRLAGGTVSELTSREVYQGCLDILTILGTHEGGEVTLTGLSVDDLPVGFQPDNAEGITMVLMRLPDATTRLPDGKVCKTAGDWRPAFEFTNDAGETSALLFPLRLSYQNRAVVDALDERVGQMRLVAGDPPIGKAERWMKPFAHS